MHYILSAFYTGIFYLLTPFIGLRLLWRSIKAPAYRQRWQERFGFYSCTPRRPVIWFHAVSVGEAEALFPLVRLIQHQHPDVQLLITSTTPTGSARIKAVWQESVQHVYLPYDIPFALKRFIRHFQPLAVVIMETEIWPNLYASCGESGIPLYVINARLSEKSMRGYRKIPALIRPALAHVKLIAAQTQEDGQRFIAIGAKSEQVVVLGNIKFDVEIAGSIADQGKALKQQQFNNRFVWLLASTHKGEESQFLALYPRLKQIIPELLLLIVPRHPERFAEVHKLCQQQGLQVVLRSSAEPCNEATDIYLGDTMGDLKMLYAAADLAFVGGSMVPVGGHNILEACAVGVPVLFGPYMANFKEIAQGVLREHAALQCQDQEALLKVVSALYRQPADRLQLAEHGKAFVIKNQGALARVNAVISVGIIDAFAANASRSGKQS